LRKTVGIMSVYEKDPREYIKSNYPQLCGVMEKCGLREPMCRVICQRFLDYIIIIPNDETIEMMNKEKDVEKIRCLMARYLIVFAKRCGRRYTQCHSYQTILKHHRVNIHHVDDATIEMGDGTVAKLDTESAGHIYQAQDANKLKAVEKKANTQEGEVQSVDPTLIDIEKDEDPNLAIVRVTDQNTKFQCVYCGRGHLSMQKEETSRRTFCNLDCQKKFYV
jgi:hypothetical protein